MILPASQDLILLNSTQSASGISLINSKLSSCEDVQVASRSIYMYLQIFNDAI